MTTTAQHQELIDECMDWFDFEQVHRAMKALNWTWGNHPPDGGFHLPCIGELRETARECLKDASDKALATGNRCSDGTGGFEASAEPGRVELRFVLSAWEAWVDPEIEGDGNAAP